MEKIRRRYKEKMKAKEVDRMIENYLKAIPKLTKKELETSIKDQKDHFIPPFAPPFPPPPPPQAKFKSLRSLL